MEGKVPGGRQKYYDVQARNESMNDSHNYYTVVQQIEDVNSFVREESDSLQADNQETENSDNSLKEKGSTGVGQFLRKVARQVSNMSLRNSNRFKKKNQIRNGDSCIRLNGLSVQPLSLNGSLCDNSRDLTDVKSKCIVCHEKMPGVVGIRNHGNTCFMNAILQCLSNTLVLTEYFLSDRYKNDLKHHNKQNAKKFGTKGELTEALAHLIKSLWAHKYLPEISNDLKVVIGKYADQYKGFSQHDAQEFLLWLLDKVHEDLNSGGKKKVFPSKGHGESLDEVTSSDAIINHMLCNKSFVYEQFEALYRSSLTCTSCKRQSNTYDPFLTMSLPISQNTRKAVFVTVVYLDECPQQVRIGLQMTQSDTVRDLRLKLASDTNILENQLLLLEIYHDGFHRTFHDDQSLQEINETDNIYAIETPPSPASNDSKRLSSPLTAIVLNRCFANNECRRFSRPIVLQVSKSITMKDFQKSMLAEMTSILYEKFSHEKVGILFQLRVIDGQRNETSLNFEMKSPLSTPASERALSVSGLNGSGPQHLKLYADWDLRTKQCVFSNTNDPIEEHESVKLVKSSSQMPEYTTLDECFHLYMQEERLGDDNAWFCPSCGSHRLHETVKSIRLWSLPNILVIHLKRFRQVGVQRTKLNTLVTFPIVGLNMSKHVIERSSSNCSSNRSSNGWSASWKPQKVGNSPNDAIFDLYAVCNHYGNMQGGHYTAFCKNALSSSWYVFDDSRVIEMTPENIVTRAAYLLFYQRRNPKISSDKMSLRQSIHSLNGVTCHEMNRHEQPLIEDVDRQMSRPSTDHSIDRLRRNTNEETLPRSADRRRSCSVSVQSYSASSTPHIQRRALKINSSTPAGDRSATPTPALASLGFPDPERIPGSPPSVVLAQDDDVSKSGFDPRVEKSESDPRAEEGGRIQRLGLSSNDILDQLISERSSVRKRSSTNSSTTLTVNGGLSHSPQEIHSSRFPSSFSNKKQSPSTIGSSDTTIFCETSFPNSILHESCV